MKVLKWIGKILVVLASIIVIAGAVIWVVNRGWAGAMLRAGRPALQEGYRMPRGDSDDFKRFDGAPNWNGVRPDGDFRGDFHGRRVSFGLGALRILSRLAIFALVTVGVFLAGYFLGRQKPAGSRSEPSAASVTPPPAPAVETPSPAQKEEPPAS